MINLNRDELAKSLQASFGAILQEANEWRPLADYILSLIELKENEFKKLQKEILDELKSLKYPYSADSLSPCETCKKKCPNTIDDSRCKTLIAWKKKQFPPPSKKHQTPSFDGFNERKNK